MGGPMLLAMLAALALCAVIAWIWRREARKPPEEFTGGTEREP